MGYSYKLVLGAGCWVLGAGCWVLVAGCQVIFIPNLHILTTDFTESTEKTRI